MIKPSVPFLDPVRLADLYSYEVLDSGADADFDALVELASIICQCPMAAITFIDKDRQWLKAKKNIEGDQTTREESFCAHAVFSEDVFVVNNTATDQRFVDHPEVKGGLRVGFYAGVPIISAAGNALGTICVIDHNPRQLDKDKIEALRIISRQVMVIMELKKQNHQLIQEATSLLSDANNKAIKILQAADAEKQKIAYDLHENITQILSAARLYLDLASENDPDKFFLQKGLADVNLSIRLAQSLTHSLVPSTLKEFELAPTLDHLLKEFARSNKVSVDFSFDPQLQEYFTPAHSLGVFYIIQSFTRNCLLGRADKISIELFYDGDIMISLQQNSRRDASNCEILKARISAMEGRMAMEDNKFYIALPVKEVAV